MPYEFLAKNGLISQGNITATGSLTVTQNITASNISASGTITATSFTGSLFGGPLHLILKLYYLYHNQLNFMYKNVILSVKFHITKNLNS